jgi:Arc/MetJ family transcription regulator
MVAHMKTTIDIADALLAEAKRIAAEQRTTLRELVEQGLRGVIEHRRQRVGFTLRDASFAGNGLRPEVADGSWQRLRDLAYEGRGA